MNLTARIKELAFQCDMDYVGIAPASRFKYAPVPHRPEDILPGAVSVIPMGIRMNQGPLLTQRRALANRKLWHTAFSYRWFAYGCLNQYFLDRAAFLVTRLLEEEGHIAVPIVASGVEDNVNLIALFSNRHAAVAAGLGEIGWNGLCLTPDSGPRQRFVSVITTARLEPDPMYHGPKICDLGKCKELGRGEPLCVRLCPLNCFSKDKVSDAEIGDTRFSYALMDHPRCLLAAQVFGQQDISIPGISPGQENYDEIRAKLRAITPARTLLEPMFYKRGHACGICLIRCPAGAPQPLERILSSIEEAS